ncbi:hypothetical protein B0H16DRAFT_1845530 [Mycena metata]|uniref:Zinc finger PHD-type domain-containing protein n=2 Tax=Mycena metata TaxID=1033252 RepID=A0AAD7IUI6_9AGAR|nr:hypothetical protein B0H16DRAFT_1845530 [Mycena metata]
MCLKCTPPVALDVAHPQKVLTHMGAHILYDSRIDRSSQPCGFCGRPFPLCHFALKKTADGLTVKLDASKGCPNFVKKFNYNVAAKSTTNSPCSNVSLPCPACGPKDPSIWRYNLKEHFIRYHPHTPLLKYRDLWELTESETTAMRKVWEKLQAPRKKKNTGKKTKATLAISAAHSSRLALIDEQNEDNSDDDSFINDSPIQTPEASDDEDNMLDLPRLSGAQPTADRVKPTADRARSPSPLEYFPESLLPLNPGVELDSSLHSTPNEGHLPVDTNTLSAGEQPSIVGNGNNTPSLSSPILVPAPPGNPTQPSATDSGTRRSTRKRKERDDLKEIQAALEACICGTSAAPEDGVDLANVAQCKNEACETKWYHLRCLEQGNVGENWVCDACVSTGGRFAAKRRRT